MTAAQRFFLLVHALLVLAFVGYTLAIAALLAEDAQGGYISEGAKAGALFAVLTVACALILVGGVLGWVRTGHRRYPLVADGIVIAASWTILFALAFFQLVVYVAVLGLTLLCPLVAAVVPGPAKRS